MTPSPPLKLRAKNLEDIKMMSALLQDALIAGHDMQYLADERCFVMLVNRYCWESDALPEKSGYQRRLCGVKIGEVAIAKKQGLSGSSGQFYNFLTMEYDNSDKCLILTFSATAMIKLAIDNIAIILQDVADEHPSFSRPDHEHKT